MVPEWQAKGAISTFHFLIQLRAMPGYRLAFHAGGTYFFTVNLLERGGNDLLVRHIALLRNVVRDVKRRHPFTIHGWVTLPDHLHCVIDLSVEDHDFPLRCD